MEVHDKEALNQIEEELDSPNHNFKDKKIKKVISELKASIQEGNPMSSESQRVLKKVLMKGGKMGSTLNMSSGDVMSMRSLNSPLNQDLHGVASLAHESGAQGSLDGGESAMELHGKALAVKEEE